MDMQQLARGVDLFASAFVFGATVWFFFIQSPVLLKSIGREKFVPIQMRLTMTLFGALTVSLVVMLIASLAPALLGSAAAVSAATLSAASALAAGLINRFLVVPSALKAGGRGRADIKGKDREGSISSFTSEGVGDRTKTLHRLVVLFVVLMLGTVVWHGITLLAPST